MRTHKGLAWHLLRALSVFLGSNSLLLQCSLVSRQEYLLKPLRWQRPQNSGRWPAAVSDGPSCTEFFPALDRDPLTSKVCPLGLGLPHKMIHTLLHMTLLRNCEARFHVSLPPFFSKQTFLFLFIMTAFYLHGWSPLCSNFKTGPLNWNIILKSE